MFVPVACYEKINVWYIYVSLTKQNEKMKIENKKMEKKKYQK